MYSASVPDISIVLAGGAVGLTLLWWLSTRRPPGTPPGPGPALPLLGHLHLMGQDPRVKFQEWRRQYGDVFSLYMGGRLVVVLNGFQAIKEALVKHADDFSHRPHIFITDKISQSKGIVSSSGPEWKEQRKTGLEILREMGMGKNVLAEKIQEEVDHFTQEIMQLQGQPVDLHRLTQVSVSNNICSIVFGQRFQYDNPDFNSYINSMEHNLKLLTGTAVLNFLPFLEHLPGDPFKARKILHNVALVEKFIDEQVASHAAQTPVDDDDFKPTDFIGAYLNEIRRHVKIGNKNTTVNKVSLQKVVGDLFVAGTETTSTAIRWALLLFLHYPEVQDKCYKEICDAVDDKPPSMRCRPEMTYLEATIMEVLRFGDIVPLSVAHATSSDATLRGYSIPKGAMVIPYLHSVLHDPDVWGDPENFRPERFIGPDGKLAKPEEFVPFSIGRRQCLGESLARMELFLYLANLVQRFRFVPAEPGKLPPLEGIFGLSHQPQPFHVIAIPRR